jgi:hypothetical protein
MLSANAHPAIRSGSMSGWASGKRIDAAMTAETAEACSFKDASR